MTTEVRVTMRRYVALTALPSTDALPGPVSVRVVQGVLEEDHSWGLIVAATVGWLPDRDGSLGHPVQLGRGRKSWQRCHDDLTPPQRADHSYQIASVIYQRMSNRMPATFQVMRGNIEAVETVEVEDN